MTSYQKIYGAVVQDFAKRTRANLEFIEEQHTASSASVFEVTQLINSLLGLLVFPQQHFWNNLKRIPLTDLPWIRFQERSGSRCRNLRQLVRYVRNSVSHFNVNFEDTAGEIVQLELWNVNPRTRQVDWRADISINDLREFAFHFIDGIIDGTLIESSSQAE